MGVPGFASIPSGQYVPIASRNAAMPLNIRSEEANKLASVAKVSKTEAVQIAHANQPKWRERAQPLAGCLKPLLDRIDSVPDTGLDADKAFFDDLNGEP